MSGPSDAQRRTYARAVRTGTALGTDGLAAFLASGTVGQATHYLTSEHRAVLATLAPRQAARYAARILADAIRAEEQAERYADSA